MRLCNCPMNQQEALNPLHGLLSQASRPAARQERSYPLIPVMSAVFMPVLLLSAVEARRAVCGGTRRAPYIWADSSRRNSSGNSPGVAIRKRTTRMTGRV